MTHHLDGVVDDVGVGVVERDQPAVSLECHEVAAARPEPGPVAALLRLSEAVELGSDVVEHSVEENAQPAGATFRHQVVEVVVGAQPRVDAVVVGGVIAVGLRREHRPQRQPGGSEFDGVVQPVDDSA